MEADNKIKEKIKEFEKEGEIKYGLAGRHLTAYVFVRLKKEFGLDENQIASITGYSPVTVARYLYEMGMKSESEGEIEEFLIKNWRKTGLFEFFFNFGLVGGDAVAVKDGEIVGIEFETRPGRYLEHRHHEDPSHEKVKFLICNHDDGTPRELFPPRLTILTKSDLEKIIEKRGGKEVEINYKAKKLIEEKIAEKLKYLYGFKNVIVEC